MLKLKLLSKRVTLKLKLCTFDQVPGPGSRSKYTNVQTSYAYFIDTGLCSYARKSYLDKDMIKSSK